MNDAGVSSAVLILVSCCAGLLLVVLVLVFQILRRLGRLERRFSSDGGRAEAGEQAAVAVEFSPGGPFEEFLNEEPARRGLTKGEQSAAYRKWRQEKGKNWSNS